MMVDESHPAVPDESVAELQRARELLRQIAGVFGCSVEDFLGAAADSRFADQGRELLRLWHRITSAESRERVLAFAQAEELRSRSDRS